MERLKRIIFVPGLIEPASAFLMVRWRLRNDGAELQVFRERRVFRDCQSSIQNLVKMIRPVENQDAVGIVTHSFGDWIARNAIATASEHCVKSMVSVAPVMKAGPLPRITHALSRNLVPEIKIIMDPVQAAAYRDCDTSVRRLVIWAKADESLRPVPLDDIANLEVKSVWATHLSVILQPNVTRMIQQHLFPPTHSA